MRMKPRLLIIKRAVQEGKCPRIIKISSQSPLHRKIGEGFVLSFDNTTELSY